MDPEFLGTLPFGWRERADHDQRTFREVRQMIGYKMAQLPLHPVPIDCAWQFSLCDDKSHPGRIKVPALSLFRVSGMENRRTRIGYGDCHYQEPVTASPTETQCASEILALCQSVFPRKHAS